MAIQVSSISELQKVMMSMVKSAMKSESDWLVNYTKDIVQETVYDAYEPDMYDRTFQLKDSVDIVKTKASVDSYSMTVGHNLKGIYWHSVKDYHKVGVPEIVTYGKYGTYIGGGYDQYGNYTYHDITPNGTYSRPRPYMDKTVEKLKSNDEYLEHLAQNINANVDIV